MLDSLARIQRQPHEMWLVKMAGRIVNLQPPPQHWDQTKKQYYQIEASLILEALGPASDSLAKRLCLKIEAYGRFLDRD
jgi:hypothetical protein